MVSVTPRPLFTPGKDLVPIVQEAGWAPGPVWTGAENLAPTGIRSPDRPARSQSLYRLRYPAHIHPLPKHILTSDFSVLPTSPGGALVFLQPPLSEVSVTYILTFRRTVCITFALTLGILTFVQGSKYGGKG